jgi:hypothetical protein
MVIGIRWDTIGTGIKAIGLGHRMPALVGTLLVMQKGCISKATGREIAAATRTTTTGTVIGTGIIAREERVAVGAKIVSSGGSTTDSTYRCRLAEAEARGRRQNEIEVPPKRQGRAAS